MSLNTFEVGVLVVFVIAGSLGLLFCGCEDCCIMGFVYYVRVYGWFVLLLITMVGFVIVTFHFIFFNLKVV